MAKTKKSKKKNSSLKDKLKQRQEENVKNRSSYMGGVLDFSKVDPDDFYKPTKGTNIIDIIPFYVKTKNHPDTRNVPGDPDYKMEVTVHRSLGIDGKKSIVCLEGTYGKPCPICEARRKYIEQGKEKIADKLKPQRRVFYNVINLKNGEGRIQIFDVSHWDFEKQILEELDDIEGVPTFADLDEGKSIRFKARMDKYKGYSYPKILPGGFSFVDRDDVYDEDIVEDAFSLDELLVVPSYEDATKLINFADNDDDEDDEEEEIEEKPKKKSSRKKQEIEEDEEEDEEEDDDDEDEIEDDEEDDDEDEIEDDEEDDDEDEIEDDEEDDDEEEIEDDEEDDDEEEIEEKPKKKSSRRRKK